MALTLVIGGTRSGKSVLAERLVAGEAAPVVYVATGAAVDPNMAARIAAHRARRPSDWRTIETSDPAGALRDCGDDAVLVDGVGTWVAQLLHDAGLLDDGAALDPGAPADLRARV